MAMTIQEVLREAINFLCETICTIWYDKYNLKNVKNTLGGVLLIVKKSCTNGTKLRKASHVVFP